MVPNLGGLAGSVSIDANSPWVANASNTASKVGRSSRSDSWIFSVDLLEGSELFTRLLSQPSSGARQWIVRYANQHWHNRVMNKHVVPLFATITVVSIGLAGAGLSGCSQKSFERLRDAPIKGRNDKPAEVLQMPDGFSNVAHKCDGHGNRVYVAFKGDENRSAIAVVRDPSCDAAS